MKISEMIEIFNDTMKMNGDQEVVVMVDGNRYSDIEVYTDDEKELYIEGYNAIRIYDIDWDTDGEHVDLPDEVIISKPTDDMYAEIDGYYGDSIEAYLSDTYGFCVFGYCIDRW